MTTTGWVATVVWVVGGLPLAVVATRMLVIGDRDVHGRPIHHGDAMVGWSIICAWLFAPVVAAVLVGVAASVGVGRAARRVGGL